MNVVLDACVLYPAPVRDILLSLAAESLFNPLWSKKIQEEWIRNLLKNRPDLRENQLSLTVNAMNVAFPEANITISEKLPPEIELPDINDLHVLVCAIEGKADSIITFNLKDFPSSVLSNFDLKSLHPDDFILELIEVNPEKCAKAFTKMVERLKNPPMSKEDVLDSLNRCGLPKSENRFGSLKY